MQNELYHYGIEGMHWGVRRYQNADGSYTPAGAARYGRKFQTKRQKAREEVKSMSDRDLEAAIKRKQNEKKYIDLSSEDISKGQDFIENLMIAAGTATVTALITTMASKGGQAAATSALRYMLGGKSNKATRALAKTLSDEELKKRVARKQAEAELARLSGNDEVWNAVFKKK